MHCAGDVLSDLSELDGRIRFARARLASCDLCPRACGVDRTRGESGYCGAGPTPRVFRHMAHSGEEPPISGSKGSGVIFFSHCTMSCVYCQNHAFSQEHQGNDRTPDEVACMMLSLCDRGCHNVNLVSAAHYLPHVLESIKLAIEGGLSAPIVWNTSSYETPDTLRALDGVVDIYLADLRYSSPDVARRLSDAPDYVDVSRRAVAEMDRQVGPVKLDRAGLAAGGLIVRHLVLPDDLAGTRATMQFVAGELSPGSFVSLMAQYYPAHRASDFPELSRKITEEEFEAAVEAVSEAGIDNGWVQEFDPSESVPGIAGSLIDPDAPKHPIRTLS